MEREVAADVRPYLKALHDIEIACSNEHHVICSAALLLHPNGNGAVEVDFFFTKMGGIAVDFDTEDGDDIMETIQRLAEKVRQAF